MTDAADLVQRARAVAENAYAPYSEFRVGAIAIAEGGAEFLGVNVENAAYGSTICAEAAAIASAASTGVRKIETVAVGCLDGGDCYPCGNCRQLMREFGVESVIVQHGDGGALEHTLDDLLPHGFGPEHLP